MGDLGVSNLYGQFSTTTRRSESTSDAGDTCRVEAKAPGVWRRGRLASGFVDQDRRGALVAPVGIRRRKTTTSMIRRLLSQRASMSVYSCNLETKPSDIFGQLGLRFVTGMSESRRPDWNGPGNHQRQELAMDDAIRRGCAIPVLKEGAIESAASASVLT